MTRNIKHIFALVAVFSFLTTRSIASADEFEKYNDYEKYPYDDRVSMTCDALNGAFTMEWTYRDSVIYENDIPRKVDGVIWKKKEGENIFLFRDPEFDFLTGFLDFEKKRFIMSSFGVDDQYTCY